MPQYAVLDKDTIRNEIMPYLTVAKRGYASKFDLVEVVNAILHKLKTGCQWEFLPVAHLFSGAVPSFKTVFYHFRKWCLLGDWERMFSLLVNKHRHLPDLSLTHVDGSHTRAVRGGECVEYQGRKKCDTTNAIYLTERQGIPLAMSEPAPGNHSDLYKIGRSVETIVARLMAARLETDGLFSNADAGFDAGTFRAALSRRGILPNVCPNPRNGEPSEEHLFDPEMYRERFVVERTNAWMDAFRSILNRFDTTVTSWKGWNYLAFAVIFLKKIHKSKKYR